ncbi:MAG: efflux RND transporter periplasmic adaptor subunit [Wenzhouxiangella sp.]|jgi:RND family efflux transporter MFP subunit|nr:efflux RND transporter periplasmic adaptor subunit [Wenzhouxiangella sp.]
MKSVVGLVALFVFTPVALAAEQVTVQPFSEIAVYLDRQAAATAVSLDGGVLAAEISARVTAVPVLPGQTVDAGQILVELDPTEYRIGRDSAQARVNLAEAALDMARIRAERARRLSPENFVSEDQLLEAETNLRLAQAEHSVATAEQERAELMLARTRISAPYPGVITQRLVSPGTLAAPGTPMLAIAAIDRLEARAMVAPDQIRGLVESRDLRFESGNQSWPLRLDRISPVIDQATRSQETRLTFIDAAPPAGAEGRIRWTDSRPALPGSFVLQRGSELGVFVLNEALAQADFLVLPGADAGRPHRADQLSPETLIIVDGRRRLQPGAPVEVIAR